MPVVTGLESILGAPDRHLRGERVGVIANPASVDSRYRHLVDLFHWHPDVDLRAVFGPQHGARGETQDNMIEWEGYRDPATGLPVHSLYGESRRPTPEMLDEVDVLVFDVPDVGTRVYTFVWTLALAMQACRDHGKRVVVLDRPNPINGLDLEGPVLDPEFSSFVGLYPLPLRHGMTVGELAGYFNREMGIGCRLEVVPMQGWQREQFFDETGLPWVMPSPNMPSLETALVFPGMVLLEGTNLSEGRGTTRPFELSGAPWFDPREACSRLGPLEGAVARPAWFIPTFHKWSGRMVGGLQVHVTSRRDFRPVRTALRLLQEYRRQGGERFCWSDPPYEYEFEKLPFDVLCGTDTVRRAVEAGADTRQLEDGWKGALDEFAERRRDFLLY